MTLPDPKAPTPFMINGTRPLHFSIVNESDIIRAPPNLAGHKFHNNGLNPIFIPETSQLVIMAHSLVKDSY